jgi:MFS family permease
MFGRIIPGFVADKIGHYNTMILITSLATLLTLCLWTSGQGAAAVVLYAIGFGFTSGGYVSLGAPCLAQISDLREIGTRTGTAYLLQAFGGLTGSPIGGQLMDSMSRRYLGLQLFAGFSMCAGVFVYVAARHAQVGLHLAKT